MERGVPGAPLVPYDTLAPDYARHRGAYPHVVEELIRFAAPAAGSRVLEVGCGTGVHMVALSRTVGGWGFGVDPSPGMIAQASESGRASFVCATARCLPFAKASFDLVFSVNVIHHVSAPRIYFSEARRISRADGLICTFTDSAEMIRRRRPLSEYWPGSAQADLDRYPDLESLRLAMSEAGFEDLAEVEVRAPFSITNAAPYRDRVFSCLRLIPDEAFDAGLARLESDLKEGPVQGESELVALWGVARSRRISSGLATRPR